MTEKYVNIGNLSVSEKLLDFVNKEIIPGTDISSKRFWRGFDEITHQLTPINQ